MYYSKSERDLARMIYLLNFNIRRTRELWKEQIEKYNGWLKPYLKGCMTNVEKSTEQLYIPFVDVPNDRDANLNFIEESMDFYTSLNRDKPLCVWFLKKNYNEHLKVYQTEDS